MSSQCSGSPTNGKRYCFISDPDHKENLSGRVRAACITCRRKKIKCSGEVPCGTCQERGTACEGLTERKRPSKRSEHHGPTDSARSRRSSTDTHMSASTRRERQLAALSESPLSVKSDDFTIEKSAGSKPRPGVGRPTANLMKLDAIGSSDSGYSSGRPSELSLAKQASTARTLRDSQRAPATNRSLSISSGCDKSVEVSPTSRAVPLDWASIQQQSGHVLHEPRGPRPHFSSDVTSAAISRRSSAWPDLGSPCNWWDDGVPKARAATDLITAAGVLERQAQNLRQLASSHAVNSFSEDVRRQTIAFPIDPVVQLTDAIEPPLPMEPFDDLFPFDQTRSSEYTSLASDFASWWDANTGLSSSLGYAPNPTHTQHARTSTVLQQQLPLQQTQPGPSFRAGSAQVGIAMPDLLTGTTSRTSTSSSRMAKQFAAQCNNRSVSGHLRQSQPDQGDCQWPG